MKESEYVLNAFSGQRDYSKIFTKIYSFFFLRPEPKEKTLDLLDISCSTVTSFLSKNMRTTGPNQKKEGHIALKGSLHFFVIHTQVVLLVHNYN